MACDGVCNSPTNRRLRGIRGPQVWYQNSRLPAIYEKCAFFFRAASNKNAAAYGGIGMVEPSVDTAKDGPLKVCAKLCSD